MLKNLLCWVFRLIQAFQTKGKLIITHIFRFSTTFVFPFNPYLMRHLTMLEKNHTKSIHKKTTGEIDKIERFSRTSNIDDTIYVFIFIFNFLDRICCSFFFYAATIKWAKKKPKPKSIFILWKCFIWRQIQFNR